MDVGRAVQHADGTRGRIIDVYHPRIQSDNEQWWLVEFEDGSIEGIPEFWLTEIWEPGAARDE